MLVPPAHTSPDDSPIEATATDHAFVMPARIRGGVVGMRVHTTGTEPHGFAFGRIDGGHTLKDAPAAIRSGKEVAWLHDLAGPPLLTPGATIEVTRTPKPGRYAFLDFDLQMAELLWNVMKRHAGNEGS